MVFPMIWLLLIIKIKGFRFFIIIIIIIIIIVIFAVDLITNFFSLLLL